MYQFENDIQPRFTSRSDSSVLCLITVLCLTMCVPIFAHEEPSEQIKQLSHEIELNPTKIKLYMARGGLHRINHHWEKALADFHTVARLKPGHPTVVFHRGRLLYEASRFQEARGFLDRFLKLNPNHVQGLMTRARCLRKLGQPLLAAQDYSRALNQMENPVSILFLEQADALAAGGAKHLGVAIKTIDEGMAQLGSLIVLQSKAIDLEVRARRYGAAIQRIDQILSRTSRKEGWLARRGEVLEQAGLGGRARLSYGEALSVIEKLPSRLKKTAAVQALAARLDRYLSQPHKGQPRI